MSSEKVRTGMRERKDKKTYSNSHSGRNGGWHAQDPPDWKGVFPAFMSEEERQAYEANRSKTSKSIARPKPKAKKHNANPYERPKTIDLKTKAPLKPSKGTGLYRRDPPDWNGRFPAFEKKTIFPFLDLPTELRAEIYTLLLGGRTIHIDYPGCKDAKRFIDGRPFLCSATISDAEAFKQHGWPPRIPPSKLYFAIRHSKCTGSVAQALPLWLIGSCKQVYTEASLTPFQENVFTFSAPQSIASFLKRLNPVQQAALTHVAVFQTSAGTMWDAPSLSEPLKLPPYLNVKKLSIFVELCPANLNPKDGKWAMTSKEVQDRWVSRMSVLWSPKLQKLEVLINNTGMTLEKTWRCLSVEEVEAWTGRIKQNLLPIAEQMEGDDENEDELSKADRDLEELLSDSD